MVQRDSEELANPVPPHITGADLQSRCSSMIIALLARVARHTHELFIEQWPDCPSKHRQALGLAVSILENNDLLELRTPVRSAVAGACAAARDARREIATSMARVISESLRAMLELSKCREDGLAVATKVLGDLAPRVFQQLDGMNILRASQFPMDAGFIYPDRFAHRRWGRAAILADLELLDAASAQATSVPYFDERWPKPPTL